MFNINHVNKEKYICFCVILDQEKSVCSLQHNKYQA